MRGVTAVKHESVDPSNCSFASYSPNGSFFLHGSDSEIVSLWSLDQLEPKDKHRFSDHSGLVNHGDISEDETKLATCSNDKTVILYSLQNGKVIKVLDHHNFGVSWCTFSPASQVIASCSWDNTIGLCDTDSGSLLSTLTGHRNPVTCATFNKNFQLASSSWDKTIRIWDIDRGTSCPMTGHRDVVWGVTYSPTTPHLLVSVSKDRSTSVWDTRMGGKVMLFQDSAPMTAATFSPDGNTLITAGEDSTIVIRLAANLSTPLRHTGGHKGKINSVSVSPCSRHLVTAGSDGCVTVWDFQREQDEVADLSDMLNVSNLLGGDSSM